MHKKRERNLQIANKLVHGEKIKKIGNIYGISAPAIYNIAKRMFIELLMNEKLQYMSSKAIALEFKDELLQKLKMKN